jgi:hypothetical protein
MPFFKAEIALLNCLETDVHSKNMYCNLSEDVNAHTGG